MAAHIQPLMASFGRPYGCRNKLSNTLHCTHPRQSSRRLSVSLHICYSGGTRVIWDHHCTAAPLRRYAWAGHFCFLPLLLVSHRAGGEAAVAVPYLTPACYKYYGHLPNPPVCQVLLNLFRQPYGRPGPTNIPIVVYGILICELPLLPLHYYLYQFFFSI